MGELFRKIVVIVLLMLCGASAYSDTKSFAVPQTVSLQTRLDYLAITMPNNQPDLGIVGVHLWHAWQNSLYAGFGLYSSATGHYNGFFSLGLDAGTQYQFSKYVGIEAGVYTGASGGHGLGGTQIGDGPLVMAHAGFIFYLKKIQLSLSESYAKFLEGEKIASNQLLVAINLPFNLCSFTALSDIPAHFKAARTDSYFGVPFTFYFPQQSYFLTGAPVTQAMGVAGVEFGQQLYAPLFYYAGVETAVSGTTIGFSIVKGGLELMNGIALPYPFFSVARLGLLLAGGNGVNSGSGLSIESQAGVGIFATKNISLRLLGGYFTAFQGRYHAITTSLALDYHFSLLTIPGDDAVDATSITPHYFRVRLDNQTYFTEKKYAGASMVVQSFAVIIDDVLTTHWFVTGQGSFSYSGTPGCYATGLLGAGYQWHLSPRFLTYVSAMGGGGSGSLTTLGQGVLVQGSWGALYQLSRYVGTYAAISKARIINTSFSPIVLDLGLSFNVNFMSA